MLKIGVKYLQYKRKVLTRNLSWATHASLQPKALTFYMSSYKGETSYSMISYSGYYLKYW